MKVIIESPFSGDFKNKKYSREAMRHSIDKGESPMAAHLLYTQPGVLDDNVPEERSKGMTAATAWLASADYVVVYCDLGVSPGMAEGIIEAIKHQKKIVFRWIRGAVREVGLEGDQNG